MNLSFYKLPISVILGNEQQYEVATFFFKSPTYWARQKKKDHKTELSGEKEITP